MNRLLFSHGASPRSREHESRVHVPLRALAVAGSMITMLCASQLGFEAKAADGQATGNASLSSPYNYLTHHYNQQRQGWVSNEVLFTPTNVGSASFNELLEFAAFCLRDRRWDNLRAAYVCLTTLRGERDFDGRALHWATTNVVYGATTNGDIYAVSASASGYVPAGVTLWTHTWRLRTITPWTAAARLPLHTGDRCQ